MQSHLHSILGTIRELYNVANVIKGEYILLCTIQSIKTDNPEGEGGALIKNGILQLIYQIQLII